MYFANSYLLYAGNVNIMAAFCLDTWWQTHCLPAADEKNKKINH